VPVKINGLPAHILLVHAVIVLIPLAAAMLVVSALWPAARARLGFLTPAVALAALAVIPVAMNAGKWLRDHLQNNIGHTNPLIVRHTHIAYDLWPWAAALFVVSAAVWLLGVRYEMVWRPNGSSRALPVWVTALVAVASLVVAIGSIVVLYRVGESGSKAVWPPGITTG
jgi:Predicted membrane protein (DUF2231)